MLDAHWTGNAFSHIVVFFFASSKSQRKHLEVKEKIIKLYLPIITYSARWFDSLCLSVFLFHLKCQSNNNKRLIVHKVSKVLQQPFNQTRNCSACTSFMDVDLTSSLFRVLVLLLSPNSMRFIYFIFSKVIKILRKLLYITDETKVSSSD